MQHQSSSNAGHIPNTDVHTNGDQYASSDQHTDDHTHADKHTDADDHTFADGDNSAATDDSDSYPNTSNSVSNRDRSRFWINQRTGKRPRESGVVVLTLLAPANQLAYNPI